MKRKSKTRGFSRPSLILTVAGCFLSLTMQAQTEAFRDTTLPAAERTADLVKRMTLEEKIDLLSGYNDFFLHPCERLGIPAFQMADGPLGVASWGLFGRATAFPSALSLAASWNRDLAKRTGEAYAREWRARGIHLMLAPGVNIYRASKGARNFEYFGEDPYLTSAMVVPFVRAVQAGGVMPVVKHFAGNDQEYDRYDVSTEVDNRTLHEIYLLPFEAAVKEGGVKAVMSGYNLLNGVHCTESAYLNHVLREEWGFKGMYMSDWAATRSLLPSVANGLDLEMGSHRYFTREQLLPLVREGKVSEAQIDEKVFHVYNACMEMGFFDRPQAVDSLTVYSPRNQRAALEAAREGIILLRNQHATLPLDADRVKRIAVVGPTANPPFISDRFFNNDGIVYGGGGSSKVNPWHVRTDLDGITEAFPDAEVYYDEGISNRFKRKLFEQSVFHTEAGKRGLSVTYYRTDSTDAVAARRVERQVNCQWGSRPGIDGVTERFRVCWDGVVDAPRDGVLRFLTDAQGAYRLWLNGKEVIDAAGSQSFHFGTATLPVKAGERITVRLEYKNRRSKPAEMRLGYVYEDDLRFDEAEKIARRADVVICCVGLDGAIELEGRDRPFDLPYGQDLLIARMLAVNPNTVVVVHAGGGVNMSRWVDKVPAVLHALYAGQEGGVALGEILSGAVNPSAKLPFSIERQWADSPACGNYDETREERKVYYREGIFTGYRGYDRSGKEPLYSFGYGLSYTTFRYDSLTVEVKDRKKGLVEATFRITNTGKRAGAEVAQLYVSDDRCSEPRPMKELKGFEKVWLQPGESRTVTLRLDERAFRFFSAKKEKWVVEKGTFTLRVGGASDQLPLTAVVKL